MRNTFSALASSGLLASLLLFACGGEISQGQSAGAASPADTGEAVSGGQCPGSSTVPGIDVSDYQGNVNWSAVAASGHKFAIARVSDGLNFSDSQFARNWSGMKAAGLIRGAYQFFEPAQDAVAQANMVLRAVGKLGTGDLPVMLDMEVSGGQSASTIAAQIARWVAAIEAGTGKTPFIYTGAYFWDASVVTSQFSNLALNVAWYNTNCPGVPNAWSSHHWTFHQYSSSGAVSGVSGGSDMDVFNGTLAQLTAFATGTGYKYAASFVKQSWPYATTTLSINAGAELQGSITLMNAGSATWDKDTKLATTVARDRASPFAGPGWLSASRLVAVSGTVAPGQQYTFNFTWKAPETTGNYDEHYDLVQEGVAWFGDQGGPPDGDIEAKFAVTAAPTSDAGLPTMDGGQALDGGPADLDAGVPGQPTSPDPDAGSGMGGMAGSGSSSGSGSNPTLPPPSANLNPGTAAHTGCSAAGGQPALLGLVLAVAAFTRRARRTS
jgi:lysozyme